MTVSSAGIHVMDDHEPHETFSTTSSSSNSTTTTTTTTRTSASAIGRPRTFGCDRWPLHYAVRTGNMEDVQYLVEFAKQNVNEQDNHDATPLYLAALTGNEAICQYLLEHGAKCDPDSGGDAARVFYVALTPELRKMLKEWNLTAASRDPFLDVLRKTFNDATYADCFVSLSPHYEHESFDFDNNDNEKLFLHYAILYTRCPSLVERLTSDSTSKSKLNSNQNHEYSSNNNNNNNYSTNMTELHLPAKYKFKEYRLAIHNLFEYLYTGEFETRDFDTALIVQDMAKTFHLQTLHQDLTNELEKHHHHKLSNKYKFKCQISNVQFLKSDMNELAKIVSTPLEEDYDSKIPMDMLVQWSDSILRCQECTWSVHNVLVCSQSEYFACALSGNFREAEEAFLELSHMVPFSSSEAVQLCLQWMYCDAFLDAPSSLDIAIILLELGSAILCPRLCAHVANTVLVPAVNVDNVFSMLELAYMYQVTKLEDTCVEVFALHLHNLAECVDFQNVIAKEVAKTQQKGDIAVTDVPLAAEIRSAIFRVVVEDKRTNHSNHSNENEYSHGSARAEQVVRLKLLQKVIQKAVQNGILEEEEKNIYL